MDGIRSSTSNTADDKGKQKELLAPTARNEANAPVAASATAASNAPSFKVYKPPTSQHSVLRDIPADDLVPTAAEVTAAYQSSLRRAEALINAPLRTQAMRDAEDRKKVSRWPTTTIRIKFSDRTQLEKTFPSTDRIKSVYAFVRDSLRDDVKPIKFVLYESPPRRELKNSDPKVHDQTLAQLQLAPSSVLLLHFEDDRLNASDVSAPLRTDILAQAVDLPSPPSFDSTSTASGSSSGKGTTLGSSSGEVKVPKWLKLPGKK